MKCYFHETEEAVASCQVCGKFLCKECASKHSPCMCDDCYENEIAALEEEKAQKKRDALIDTNAEFISAIIKGLICAAVFLLVINVISGANNGTPPTFAANVVLGAIFFFVPFGWAVITYAEQWLPSFLMGGIIFLVYLIIKLWLSIIIGVPCFLYQLIKFIVRRVQNKRQSE